MPEAEAKEVVSEATKVAEKVNMVIDEKIETRFKWFDEKSDARFKQSEEKADARFKQFDEKIDDRFRWFKEMFATK